MKTKELHRWLPTHALVHDVHCQHFNNGHRISELSAELSQHDLSIDDPTRKPMVPRNPHRGGHALHLTATSPAEAAHAVDDDTRRHCAGTPTPSHARAHPNAPQRAHACCSAKRRMRCSSSDLISSGTVPVRREHVSCALGVSGQTGDGMAEWVGGLHCVCVCRGGGRGGRWRARRRRAHRGRAG